MRLCATAVLKIALNVTVQIPRAFVVAANLCISKNRPPPLQFHLGAAEYFTARCKNLFCPRLGFFLFNRSRCALHLRQERLSEVKK